MPYYHSSYQKTRQKKRHPFRRFLIVFFLILFAIAGTLGYFAYEAVFAPNVWTEDDNGTYIYISNDDDFEAVKKKLYANGSIIHRKNFEWVAQYKAYPKSIKAGRYKITNGLSNNNLVNLLRSGNQEPVKLRFNNIRLKTDLAKRISEQINVNESYFLAQLNDSNYTKTFGFTTENIKCMFLPNTYYIFWNTDSKEFISRMNYEYDQFWTAKRKAQAAALELTPIEVSILASIVEKESQKNDEKPRIAGVYLNRLKNNWRLQADPTLVYAMGNFQIKRVLNVFKEFESPYNTYKHTGLPPGPICIPSIASIEAVLNAEEHSYFFFCAKPDYSGYHNFAKHSRQHINNANAYREFLNKEGIYK
ncbi:MAG: aminodeoxychorismate lyase [Bacteroidetes bacterium 4572_77]|nr:MAG: aminodeoxychorismate lyase [Bacteroidetes bacterium 4572_77]